MDKQLQETHKIVLKNFVKVLICGLLVWLILLLVQVICLRDTFNQTIRIYVYSFFLVGIVSLLLTSIAILKLKSTGLVTAVITADSLITVGS